MSYYQQRTKKIEAWTKINVYQLVEILNNYTHIQIGRKRYSIKKSWDRIVRDWQEAWREVRKPKKGKGKEVEGK